MLLLLLQLLHPNGLSRRDQALHPLEASVLVKVPAEVIDVEPLHWLGLMWRCRGLTLLR
jgi:hypothetical protein